MTDSRLSRAADEIAAARLKGLPLSSLPFKPETEAEGYAIQALVHEHLEAAGKGALTGYKLGATTKAMMDLLGIPAPIVGGIVASGVHGDGASFKTADFQKHGVEVEVVVKLGKALEPGGAPYDADKARDAVAEAMVGIEVINNRYGDPKAAGAPTLIADDVFQHAAVFGTPKKDWASLDLANAKGRVKVDGEVVAEGEGKGVMGHPLNALVWFANAAAERGVTVPAGFYVMTGSLVPPQWLPGPCAVEVEIDGLGKVGTRFV
jgi:2-keto-4-pentenoate hydratase